MDSPTDVKSIVRGWLQASPNIGRIKLAPSPSTSSFSPRPERLGLGATPPQDLTVRVYQIQLETRVRRKVLGKGRNHQDIEIGLDAVPQYKSWQCESSDEECSRSSSVRKTKQHMQAAGVNVSLKNKRKKKKKKRELTTVSSAHEIVEHLEDPLPLRRDLLRGGSAGIQRGCQGLELHPSSDLSVDSKLTIPSLKQSNTSCAESKCVSSRGVTAVRREKEVSLQNTTKEKGTCEFTNGSHSCGTALKKRRTDRRMRWRTVHRRQSLPWSPLSRRPRKRRQLNAQLQRLLQ